MILADKIIKLRKKNGWSQEELSDKMNVSRQAVSKWESAQTVPDLERILQLGALFGVTTDYLLKDEIEDEEFTSDASDNTIKRITVEEANTYLEQRKRAAWQIAIATLLCIISPITLFILGAATDHPSLGVSETVMGTVGLAVLFAFVLAAVPIYIYCGFKNEPYAFLDKNVPFELEYGVKGIVTERQRLFRASYVRCNIIATCICIFSPLPLIITAFNENVMLSAIMLGVMIALVGIAVMAFIVVGVQWAAMQKLLKEGEYTEREKQRNVLREVVGAAYWGVLAVVYLIWSNLTNDWHITWIVFAAGGVLSPLVTYICNLISDRRKNS